MSTLTTGWEEELAESMRANAGAALVTVRCNMAVGFARITPQ
jgi:hypothetical protein